jgi:laminin alpha 3/5
VHYYQPNHPNVVVNVKLRGSSQTGVLNAAYCPSLSGCRAVIEFEDNQNRPYFDITFKLNETKQNVWIEKVYLHPYFDSEKLNYGPISMNDNFIAQCSPREYLDIEHHASEFCDDSVLAIAGSYHGDSAASPCNCNKYASKAPDLCEFFGGQCSCLDHVIGRSCDRCRTGYCGFPNCRKCESRNCDPNTCLPIHCNGCNVTECLDGFHSFNSENGCRKCSCDKSVGVIKGYQKTCDKKNGQCKCKPNMAGVKCDKCKAGHYNYPHCFKCECSTEGTTTQQCDPNNGQCLCKENTMGDRCDTCKPGTFNLDSKNIDGNILSFYLQGGRFFL